MTSESYFPNFAGKVTNSNGSLSDSDDIVAIRSGEHLVEEKAATKLVESTKTKETSLEHNGNRRDEFRSDCAISDGDCPEITERLTKNYRKSEPNPLSGNLEKQRSSEDQCKTDKEYQMTAEDSTNDQKFTSPTEFEQTTCTENSSVDITGSPLYKQRNISVLPKAPSKFDYVQTKDHTDRVEKFDRQWPTTIEEARRREQELKTARSSSTSISSQHSIDSANITERKIQKDSVNITVRKTPKDSVNITEGKTPKEEVRSVEIEKVQAKRILVKSFSDSDNQTVTWPGEEEATPLDNIESIPSDHSLESKAPKKRSRFRKMMRAIGKCLSHWCYPAVDTISYGEPYTLAQ